MARLRYRMLLAGMAAAAIAFAAAIPLGFWLRAHYPAMPDETVSAIVVGVLVAIAFSMMRLMNGPWSLPMKSDFAPNRTGYEMTLDDFRQLVSEPYSQSVVVPLLREWYQYEISGEGSETAVRSAEGREIGLRELHAQIQADPAKQYRVYQEAMTLWR